MSAPSAESRPHNRPIAALQRLFSVALSRRLLLRTIRNRLQRGKGESGGRKGKERKGRREREGENRGRENKKDRTEEENHGEQMKVRREHQSFQYLPHRPMSTFAGIFEDAPLKMLFVFDE